MCSHHHLSVGITVHIPTPYVLTRNSVELTAQICTSYVVPEPEHADHRSHPYVICSHEHLSVELIDHIPTQYVVTRIRVWSSPLKSVPHM
jgi:hypothetical protein